jgi:hypothetical protein
MDNKEKGMSLGLKIGIGAASLLVLAGGGFLAYKLIKRNSNDVNSSDTDELEGVKSSGKSSRKNMYKTRYKFAGQDGDQILSEKPEGSEGSEGSEELQPQPDIPVSSIYIGAQRAAETGVVSRGDARRAARDLKRELRSQGYSRRDARRAARAYRRAERQERRAARRARRGGRFLGLFADGSQFENEQIIG